MSSPLSARLPKPRPISRCAHHLGVFLLTVPPRARCGQSAFADRRQIGRSGGPAFSGNRRLHQEQMMMTSLHRHPRRRSRSDEALRSAGRQTERLRLGGRGARDGGGRRGRARRRGRSVVRSSRTTTTTMTTTPTWTTTTTTTTTTGTTWIEVKTMTTMTRMMNDDNDENDDDDCDDD